MSTPTPTPKNDQDSGNHVRQSSDPSASDALFAKWVKDPQENGDYVLSLSPEETRKFFEEVNAVLAEAVRERDQALAVIDIGQVNCDAVYNDLKRERDLAKVNASLDREKAVKLRTQLAEEQAHADMLALALKALIKDISHEDHAKGDWSEQVVVRRGNAALQAHALRRKPPA